MTRILLALLVILPQVLPGPAVRLHDSTAAIAQGATTAERRAAITSELKAKGVDFRIEEFMQGTRSGANIVVTIPGKPGSKILLLGAHYDRVAGGQGAIDNAASCAVLLELAGRFKSNPLANTVTIVFFDLEEVGLVGSREYFRTLDPAALPAEAMNFDIFGYGETFFVTPSKADGPLLAAMQKAADAAGFPLRSFPMAKYPDSDHEPMAAAGIETLGVALIDGAEIDAIITPGSVRPRILSMIHTNADTMAQVREQDMAKALPVLEQAIRMLDGN